MQGETTSRGWQLMASVLLVIASRPVGAAAADESWTLPSGLRVLVTGEPSAPAHALLFVDAGWKRDPPGASGTAELAVATIPLGSRVRSRQELRLELGEIRATLVPHVAADHALLHLTIEDPAGLERGLAAMAVQ